MFLGTTKSCVITGKYTPPQCHATQLAMTKRTSFQDAEQAGKTLAELIADDSQEEQRGELSAEDSGELQDAVPAENEDEQSSQGSEGGAAEPTDGSAPAPLARYLRENGYNVDDSLSEEDLYGSLLKRLKEQDRIRQEAEEIRREREKVAQELERLRSGTQDQPPQKQEPQTPAEKKAEDDLWAALKEVDRDLLKMVERDPNTGMFRSREQYEGVGGEEAARQINEYNRRVQQRSNELINNPVEVVWKNGLEKRIDELARKRAEEIVEEKLKSLGDIKNQAVAAFEKKREAEDKQYRIDKFWNDHARDFLKLNERGEPIQDLSGNYVRTQVGSAFYDECQYLREILGIKDEEKVITTAWRNVSRGFPSDPPKQEDPVKQEEPVVEAARGGEEKRRRFVQRRVSETPEVPANQGGFVNSGKSGRMAGKPSLLDLAKEDPEVRRMLDLE